MLQKIDETFNLIRNEFKINSYSTELIDKAYNLAKELHKNQVRKDGKLYISHPVEVALILAKLGFDENVISAALLHDVVEDCDCSLDDIRKDFNNSVAELVDCVSAIDKTKFALDKTNIYEDTDFEKASIEEQSFKKLINIGKNNPLGFCIKFADRLHNLRTIECFDYSKQLEKVKETERWIIPIAKIMHAEYFYRSIKNECFKIKNRYNGKIFFEHYNNYHKSNALNIEKLQYKLKEIFADTPIKLIKIKNVREYKVFEDLTRLFKNIQTSRVSTGQILKVTNYNMYLLYENKKFEDTVGEILNIINKKLTDIVVIDAKIGNFTEKPYFQLEDKYKNKFNLYIESYSDYIKQRNGTLDGHYNDLLDTENLDNMNVELIKVKTKTNENKFIPKGSTALDFAFKIHRNIGLGFKYAIINGSKTKSPPYTKLYEGDQIEIIVDKNDNGDIILNPKLKWLAYVTTDIAKKLLINYFDRIINNH